MPGLMQGFEIGKRALMTHQVSLQTIGHNIANVNTPGYSRQRVRISTALPEYSAYGPIGSGVRVDDIRHVRDLFLGKQYREGQKSLGKWSYKEKALGLIEDIFNEPQENSLAAGFDDFWNAWSHLSTNTDDASNRNNVLAMANQLINRLTQLADSINGQRDSIDRDLTNLTSEVNRLTTEIARVNQQIQATELGNIQASDLRDVRDRLTDELSNIIDVNVIEKENGATVVSMGSMMLVDGSYSLEISAGAEYQGQQVTHYLVWKGTNVKLRNLNGQLAGLVETRDEVIPRYLDQLNEMARLFIEQVNTLHRSGYGLNGTTNVDFFDPNYTDAATIRLNSEIVQDINRIAASESPDGDNIIALQMADMRNIRLLANQTMTINDFYNGLVGNLGVEMRETTSFASNYELLVQQVDGQRQSVQGVSLDEEMANMVKFQHAYDAAARVITVMDQALDTIISEMVLLAR